MMTERTGHNNFFDLCYQVYQIVRKRQEQRAFQVAQDAFKGAKEKADATDEQALTATGKIGEV